MSKLSIAGTEVVNNNGRISFASLYNVPTLYYNVATTRTNTSLTYQIENLETTGTTIRVYAKKDAVG